MKKIGFIDYFLDEWHAEKYPEWIRSASNGEMTVAYAYGMKDSDTGRSNEEWCAAKGITLLPSIEKVVEESDYLIVLSPDNPERHEELSALPLQSGKPTYVDKTFAPDRETAVRMFEAAAKHGTPMYSTSALRYAAEYAEADRHGVEIVCSLGPGRYDNYAIHQIEPIISLMGAAPSRVMFTGTPKSPALALDFEDGRQASIRHFGWECPFSMTVNYSDGHASVLKPESDFFQPFIANLVEFFGSGKPSVEPSETIAVISTIEAGYRAAQSPFEWVRLPGRTV